MVSGLVTSPYDQARIDSGDARLMRIASKLLTSRTRFRSCRSLREYPRPAPLPPLPKEREASSVVNLGMLVLDIVPPILVGYRRQAVGHADAVWSVTLVASPARGVGQRACGLSLVNPPCARTR